MLPNLYIQSEIKSLSFLKRAENVIYVGPELSAEDKSLLTATGVHVIFVQDILAKLSKEVLEYNFPGVALPEVLSVDSINSQIRSELEFSTDPTHYMVVHFEHGKFTVYDAETNLDKLVWYLRRLVEKSAQKEKPKAKKRFSIMWNHKSKYDLYDDVKEEIEQEPCQDAEALKEDTDDIRFSVNDNPVKMDESIASLTDPLNNSICEKCAAIKKAFMLKVHDNVARNYYITGMQGGEKGIALDRNLVEWECQL